MNLIQTAIRQPVTVIVGVILILLSGVIALQRIPIQLTPNVEDTIIAINTYWEGASPEEIEQEIIDEQEEKLQGIANLKEITSQSVQGSGSIRLEFAVGTSKELALREVSDKLREVPNYPENVYEPIVEASDPENRDYIAWIVFETTDTELDIRTLQDFAEDRIKPVLERVPGMSEINVLGGREREVQVRYDPMLLAQRGISASQLVAALRAANRNVSGGQIAEDKSDVRLRLVNQFADLGAVERTVIAQTPGGPVLVRDVAEVVADYKKPTSFVRSSGVPVIAINAQKEVGANVMEVMGGLQDAIGRLNEPGGMLDTQAQSTGLSGTLALRQVYDETTYIDDALQLVQTNIWLGGGLAMIVLFLFLRSVRSAGIIAMAIPISVVGAVATMVAIGRTVNVISLAGMAFAVGMVVDNAIVVLENIFRHLEMGKSPPKAALDGAREVFGAVLASTLTTVVVFVPILLIQDEAGQLFRDIALAIIAAVSLSLLVSVTVIPMGAARILKPVPSAGVAGAGRRRFSLFGWIPRAIGGLTYKLGGSVIARVLVIAVLTAVSVVGTMYLVPPADYLPQGNRNMVFGLMIPPPGYNLDQRVELAKRVEETIEPFWMAGKHEPGSPEYQAAATELPEIPHFDFMSGGYGDPVVPPPLENYFVVAFPGAMFHGGISLEPARVVEYGDLFGHATRGEMAPGVLAFAFQVPLFQLGGATGSAVKINFSGPDLEEVSQAALLVFLDMMQQYGPQAVQPSPPNFNIRGPELQVVPDLVRLAEVGLTAGDLGLAVQTLGDGAIIGDYRIGGQNIDLKVMTIHSMESRATATLADAPIATREGIVPLSALGDLRRVNSPPQINREGRQRAVTLQFTPPQGIALEQAIAQVDELLATHREQGTIPPTVGTSYSGSASKLASVQSAMFGDGTPIGLLSSAMVLALLVVYLLMCVLFQSFLRPLIIMFSVPLATLGGFAALFAIFLWSLSDPYMPIQKLDILTLLGFVILIGVVVNNAILIVHQSRNFMLGDDEAEGDLGEPMPPRRAIAEAVRTRVRPIFMSTFTSIGGMAPLVFMPGSGSELYRGLGSVVVGGLLVSMFFTLFLVPSLLSLLTDFQAKLGILAETREVEERKQIRLGTAAGALLLLVLILPVLPGCTSTPPTASPRMESLMRDVVEDQLALLGPQFDTAYEPGYAPTRVDEVLGDRLDELETEGGPDSYDSLDLELPKDLAGFDEALRPVDVGWAVTSATEFNLGVRFSREQALAAEQGITVARAEFDPTFFSDLELAASDDPRVVPVIGGFPLGSPSSSSNGSNLGLGLRDKYSGGGTLTASTSLDYYNDRSSGISFSPNPAYRTDLSLVFEQPLLAGRGSEVALAEVTLRTNEYLRSEQVLREDLLLVMEAAEHRYWDLQEAWKLLAIQQLLTERGERIESVLRERQSFDTTPAQYSDALATVEQRRANQIRTQRLVGLASDQLKALVNDPATPLASEGLLQPGDDLVAEPLGIGLREAVAIALTERPEIQRVMLTIEDTELRARVAKNLRQPLLDLRAGAAITGLDDDPGSSYSSMFGDEFYSVFVGLGFEQPIGNRAKKAIERAALIENRAAVLDYEQVVIDVILEVKVALRNVQTDYSLVGATRAYRVAQTENLRALMAEQEQRSDLTPEFLNLVFQRQERLAQAQLAEVSAIAAYNRSLATLHRATGSGLRAGRIEIHTIGE